MHTLEPITETRPIASLAENAEEIVKKVRQSGRPMVITVDGEPAVVVQDVSSYDDLASMADYNDTVRVLRERLADINKPEKWLTHEEMFGGLREKYGIPRKGK